MRLTRRVKIQLSVVAAVSLLAGSIMVFNYLNAPQLWFGIDRYTVTVQLPRAGGLYERANVTYRGTEVGRVTDVRLTDNGVEATLSLTADVSIPSDVDAEVHSQSAIGEQYVALLPRSDSGPHLRGGDVIPLSRSSVPPDINTLLNATNLGLQAIPHDNLKTTIDESYLAVGGLGPDLTRLVKGSTTLAIDAGNNLDALTALIDGTAPVLQSQIDTAPAIHAWADNLARVTDQLKTRDSDLAALLSTGSSAAAEARALIDKLHPTVPIILANLVSLGEIALAYQPNIEQLLVLLPQGTAAMQSITIPNRNTKQDVKGAFLDFNLNLNLPPPCTTGFLPPQQQRTPSHVDAPERSFDGDLYCRVPQDAQFNVRGARNTPCATVPGKRAPTVRMCESTDNYVPLNDGYNWKGDPNATTTGQAVPQPLTTAPIQPGAVPPGPAPPVITAAEYDPQTGTYTGPDGQQYTQADLAHDATANKTWQSMLLPPAP